jgi:hypothetical protein
MAVMRYTVMFIMAKNLTVHALLHARIVHLARSITARVLGMRWHAIGH